MTVLKGVTKGVANPVILTLAKGVVQTPTPAPTPAPTPSPLRLCSSTYPVERPALSKSKAKSFDSRNSNASRKSDLHLVGDPDPIATDMCHEHMAAWVGTEGDS